jgi:hypothetical protein
MGRDFRFAQRVAFCVRTLPWLGLSILAALTLSSALLGQTTQGQTSQDSKAVVHLPTDWSHHHLVFSNPATAEQLKRLQQDPRYWQQLFRRSRATTPEAGLGGALTSELQSDSKTSHASKKHRLKRDWSVSLGAAGATVGAGQYPGKFGFDVTTSSCANDFVVFNTSLSSSVTQASIIAYNNLYSGCGGTVPKVYWAYNTGGTITTSVTLSADGSQLAFVQAQAGGAALVLLKWASTGGSASSPTAPTSYTAANYRNCTPKPCMTTLPLNGGPNDSHSAPFYDFSGTDTLYVGDDTGKLHQFTKVFTGTPTETITTSVWPATVGVVPLSSPVFDLTSGNVFVTTSYDQPSHSGARLAAVCATSTCTGVSNGNATVAIGTVTPSLVLGPTNAGNPPACHGTGASGDLSNLQLDSPIVDPVAGKVYVFVGNDGAGNSAVIQFSTTVGTAPGDLQYHVSCGTEALIGSASTTGVPVFAGTFDNLYFNSTGSKPSGNLYVCGNTSADATVYQVQINSNVMTTSGTSRAVSSAATTCSPVTEVYNTPNDYIFLSVESNGSTSNPGAKCPAGGGGCVMSYSVPTALFGVLPASTTATATASGGTSGIVIDNVVTQGSEIYFSTLTGSHAVQASQSGVN